MTWTCSCCETLNAADAARCLVCDTTRKEALAHETRAAAAAEHATAEPQMGVARRRRRGDVLVVVLVAAVCVGVVAIALTSSSTRSAVRAPASSPAGVLRRHYEQLNDGHYRAAFHLMARRYRHQNPAWARQRQAAAPHARIIRLGPVRLGGHSARVFIRFSARDRFRVHRSDTRCRHFAGWAHLVREHGHWRYDPLSTHYRNRVVRGGCVA